MQLTPASSELGRVAPLLAGSFYLNFISQYGSIIVTTIAIVYGVMQMVFRYQEHRKLMKEKVSGSD